MGLLKVKWCDNHHFQTVVLSLLPFLAKPIPTFDGGHVTKHLKLSSNQNALERFRDKSPRKKGFRKPFLFEQKMKYDLI